MTELFHYTNRKGLLGILAARAIWASDPLYLNDSGEILHGYRQLIQALENETRSLEASDDPLIIQKARIRRSITESLERMVKSAPGQPTTIVSNSRFVASFSEADDDLNQWRAYCAPGDGYAIGFDRSLLGQVMASIPGRDQSLWKCTYGDGLGEQLQEVARKVRELTDHPDAPRLLLSPGLERALGIASENPREMFEPIDIEVLKLTALGLDGAMKHKHQCFSSEKEHRLVVGELASGVEYRIGRNFVIPYVAVALEPLICRGLFTSIRVGPGPQLDLDVRSTRGLVERACQALGVRPPPVQASELPLRG